MSWFCAYQDCQHLDAFWQSAAGETVCLMVYWGSKELQSTLHTVLGRPIVRCKVGLLLELTWLPRRHSHAQPCPSPFSSPINVKCWTFLDPCQPQYGDKIYMHHIVYKMDKYMYPGCNQRLLKLLVNFGDFDRL